MSKHLAMGACFAAALAFASFAFAGDYHANQALVCMDCHVMHYSQQHGYTPTDGTFTPLGAGPHPFLLRNEVNELCLSCHDAQAFAPDVFESHSNGYVRQAGALNEEGGSGLYPPNTGHTLNSTATAPGSNPPWNDAEGLNCADCHSPHGRGNGYRNLFAEAASATNGNAITYAAGPNPNPLSVWVYEDAASGVNANHYGIGALTFNEPDQTTSGYANFCKSCHTDFHGAVAGTEIGGTGTPAEEFIRHPAGGVNIGAIGGGHSNLSRLTGKVNQVQVMSSAGHKAGSYVSTDTDLSPSCFSCHKGHGNQNAFGLVYMVGTGTVTEQGDAGVDMRNTCRQCHTQGGAATNPW